MLVTPVAKLQMIEGIQTLKNAKTCRNTVILFHLKINFNFMRIWLNVFPGASCFGDDFVLVGAYRLLLEPS
jgi:hypothetical protein